MRVGWVALLLVAAPGGAADQQRTASLEIRLRGTAEEPLAGVTLEAERDDGPERYACTTREDGRCVMMAVAPGRYRIATAPSHPEGVHAIIDLAPGDRGQLTLRAPPVPAAATRAANDAPFATEPPGAALGREALARLPAGRALFDALRLDMSQPSPGDWRLDWAPSTEPQVFLEGIEWSGPLTPHPLGALRLDSAPGSPASSARGTAGAFDAVLRSGGARFEGELSASYEGSGLAGAPRPFSRYSPWDGTRVERGLTVPATAWVDLAPTASLGGPLGRPGLSFLASGSYGRRTRHREAVFIDDPDRLARRFSWCSWSGQASGNVTAAARGGRRVRLALILSRGRNRGGAPALEPDQGTLPDGSSTAGLTRAPFLGAVETLARWHDTGADSRRLVVSPSLDWPLGPRWSLGADASLSLSDSWTPPSFRGREIRHLFASSNARVAGIPPDEAHAAGYADHRPSYGTVRDASRRMQLSLEARWSPGRRATHLLSAGVRTERQADSVYIGHALPVIRLHWNQSLATSDGQLVRGRYGYYTVSRSGTIGAASATTVAAWLQDRWSPLGRLTIEAGVRAEREAPPSYARGPDIRTPAFGFDDKLAPRLSVTWRPDRPGNWRVDGSFGTYFDHLTTRLARAIFGARHNVRESWTLDTIDWPGLACDEGRRDCPGQFIERVDTAPPWNALAPVLGTRFGPTTRVDPALRPMQSAEWRVGVERRLGDPVSLAVRYTGKRLVRAVEDVDVWLPGGGHIPVLANPGAGYGGLVAPQWPSFPLPRATRRYDGLEVEFRRRGRPVTLTARYRFSRLAGNYGGLAAEDEGGRESTNLTSAFDSLFSCYDRLGRPLGGPLPGDRPHRLGIDAVVTLPSGTTLAVSGLVESGRPESSVITFQGAPVFFNGYGDLGRQPAFSQLDLQLRQDVRVGRRQLTLEAVVDNVFDQAAPLAFASTDRYRDDLPLPEAAFFATPWDPVAWVSALRAAGVQVRDEQLFLVPDRFQRARRVALTARVRF
jgi:hypothetical protein